MLPSTLTPCGNPLRVSTLATELFGRNFGVVAGSGPARTGAGCDTARDQLSNGMGDRVDYVLAQFAVLPGVFLLEAEPLILAHICPSYVFDLLDDVKHDLFRALVPLERALAFSHISACYVSSAVDRECHAVRHLLAPALGIEAWVVPSLLACVDVDPSLLMFRVNLGPDVVFGIPHPADPTTDGSAKHAEAIGPLAAPASPRL